MANWTVPNQEGAAVSGAIALRAAVASDVAGIAALVNGFAAENVMVPRTTETIALSMDDHVVAWTSEVEVLARARGIDELFALETLRGTGQP